MKLYAFRPSNPGPLTFCLMAGNVEHAWMVVDKHIERHYKTASGKLDDQVKGWGRLFVTGEEEDLEPDHYTVTETLLGEVLEIKTKHNEGLPVLV